MQSVLKFGNSLSGKHIQYFRNKMNLKFAAQTVADAIESIMYLVFFFFFFYINIYTLNQKNLQSPGIHIYVVIYLGTKRICI